jgi:hypothetical protein
MKRRSPSCGQCFAGAPILLMDEPLKDWMRKRGSAPRNTLRPLRNRPFDGDA